MTESKTELHQGDCLDLMGEIPDGSIDAIICDLPYGVTDCNWDTVIPFEPLWTHYKRIIKPRGAIVLNASQPFTSALVMSNREWFKYCWYWEKPKGANFALTGFQPLKVVEEIAVFSQRACTFTRNGNGMAYNPQKTPLEKPYSRDFRNNQRNTKAIVVRGKRMGEAIYTHATPRNLLYGSTDGDGRVHPTQKPVALMEYMIRTYTREGETVLDNCMGSGTTMVACLNTNRHGIGMELDPGYFAAAQSRIAAAQAARSELLIA